jgi:GNAT superfamily N-acetyltransferase
MRVEIVDEARTRALRRTVLRPNLPPDAPLPGDELADAVHLAAGEGDEVVGTCFIYPEPCPWQPERPHAWHLRQMATAEGRRGRGVGAAVLQAALDAARARGGELLWCNARETAVGFYRRHGLLSHGEVFTDEHHPIPHRRMWRDLSA